LNEDLTFQALRQLQANPQLSLTQTQLPPTYSGLFNYAKGSTGELRTQIYIGIDIGYIDKTTGRHWLNEAKQISKMLAALIKARKSFTPKPRAPDH
jgi:hypothetical protein